MPHSDVDSDESGISFDYEDDENLLVLIEDDGDIAPSSAKSDQNDHLDVNFIVLWPKSSLNHLCLSLYRPMKLSWYIMEKVLGPAKKIKDTLIVDHSLDEILVMLHYKKWLVDELTSDFYDDQKRLRLKCGLPETLGETYSVKSQGEDYMCFVCCESGPLETFSLSCGHEFCAPCYGQYLQGIISKGELARCMDPQCNLALYHADVEKLLQFAPVEEPQLAESAPEKSDSDSDSELEEERQQQNQTNFDNYEYDLAKAYDVQVGKIEFKDLNWAEENQDPVLSNQLIQAAIRVALDSSRNRFKWCPAVDCETFVELSNNTRPFGFNFSKNPNLEHVPIVRCPSSHEFCFDCQYENHLPCSCLIAAQWIKRCQDDSETFNWIDANTQNCPQCTALIEKNGGCNYMVCQHCRFQFCWICLHDWRAHTQSHWSCNRFHERKQVDLGKTEAQNALARYLHYYKRFAIHQTSMKGDERTLNNIHRYMLIFMKSQTRNDKRNVSWDDAQFMSDAVRSLIGGRRTLMWTYAFMFYLNKGNYCEILEGMQDYLNETVEALSKIFEDVGSQKKKKSEENIVQALTKKKSKIIHLSSLVVKRQKLLIESAKHGINEGSLTFNVAA